MQAMTHRERFLNALDRKPSDRLAWGDGLWGETSRKYIAQGKLKEGEDHVRHFDSSWRSGGWLNSTADLDFKEQVIEETEETRLVLSGNGAKLRWWKTRSGTPEHVDFAVKDRAAWESLIKPHLLNVDRRRISFEGYRNARRLAAEERRAFCWSGVAPFEQMHPVCGHEYMLMGMALDPDWVKDMVMTYADFTLMHLDTLFAEEGLPDAFWFYEDMGFKERPFMSPAMYQDIIEPGHKKLFDYAHSKGRKVIVHSCGYVAPLVPGLIRAGMDCLQAMEVKAGMDMPALAREFGDRIAFCGGVDIRVIATNDRRLIDEEIERKIGPVMAVGSGYIVHSDHSIPPEVEHDTLVYFFDKASRMADRHPGFRTGPGAPARTEKLRVGVIGLGIGRGHAKNFQADPRVKVTAVADPDTGRRDLAAKELGVPALYDSAEAMIEKEPLDIVCVATPNKFHAALTIAALNKGCHVLCEKPMAMNAAESRQMLDAARRNCRRIMINFSYRFTPQAWAIKQEVDRGAFGDIYFARTVWLRRRGMPGFGGWFGQKALSGGGPLIDLGVHRLDLALWLMGYPTPVWVMGSTYDHIAKGIAARQGKAFDVEDLAVGLVKFANGATLEIEASWAGNIKEREHMRTQVLGTRGGFVHQNLDEGYQMDAEMFIEHDGILYDMKPHAPIPGVPTATQHFVDSIVNDKPHIATGEEGHTVMQVLDAIYASAAKGEPVRLQ